MLTNAFGEKETMKLTTLIFKQTIFATSLSLLLNVAARAEAKLSLLKASSNTVAINLENTTPVAGLQFTVSGSSNLVLEALTKSGRTENSGWQIYQYQPNDSTINVVMLNTNLSNLPQGAGAIAQLSLKETSVQGATSRLTFSRVVVADERAQSMSVTLASVEWSSSVEQVGKTFTLEQNYPNPFNPTTTIRYRLEQPSQVRLSIFDITGREVMRVFDEYQFGGSYSVTWKGRDQSGHQLASGVYFAQLNVNGALATMRMTLAK